MRFVKMHGIGNDYVYVDGFSQRLDNPAGLARRVSNRHFGIGGDGLILILPSSMADVQMRMFNADGSEAAMCGNGIRCVAKFAHDHGLARANPMHVQTGAGVKTIQLALGADGKVRTASVDMGEPILEPRLIPVRPDAVLQTEEGLHVIEVKRLTARWPEDLQGVARQLVRYQRAFPVSMGNPHVVLFCRNVQRLPLEKIGPLIERNRAFPARANVHFVQVQSRRTVTMRTWERGSGITLACGTGASAVCVAGVLAGRTAPKILAHLPGGDLHLEWRESDNHVYMTGPAVEVFSGDWPE